MRRYREVIVRLNVTDRAKRYRANREDVRPPGPKQCNYCGRRKNVGVDHVDGVEDHGEPENLIWACKRCNSIKANLLKAAGLGKRVAQFNPRRAPGGSKRDRLKAYGDAIKVMRGDFEGNVSHAIATIRATPQSLRSEFTSRSWPVRRQIYGSSGRQSELPF